jgi:hypothetical protein
VAQLSGVASLPAQDEAARLIVEFSTTSRRASRSAAQPHDDIISDIVHARWRASGRST